MHDKNKFCNRAPATDSVVQLEWGRSGSVKDQVVPKNWAKFQVYVPFEYTTKTKKQKHLTGHTDAPACTFSRKSAWQRLQSTFIALNLNSEPGKIHLQKKKKKKASCSTNVKAQTVKSDSVRHLRPSAMCKETLPMYTTKLHLLSHRDVCRCLPPTLPAAHPACQPGFTSVNPQRLDSWGRESHARLPASRSLWRHEFSERPRLSDRPACLPAGHGTPRLSAPPTPESLKLKVKETLENRTLNRPPTQST